MNHQKLLCLYVLFRDPREKKSNHWAVRKAGIKFYGTSSTRATVPPESALYAVILPGRNTSEEETKPPPSKKKIDNFLQICQNCSIILLLASKNIEMKYFTIKY